MFGVVMAVTALFMTVFLVVFKNRRSEEKLFDIKICQGESELSTKGFLDTGNLLVDPYVNLPVSLIAKETLKQIQGSQNLPCRYIPFVSLGKEHGLIPAVTLDGLVVQRAKTEVVIRPAVFAVVEEEFLKNNTYRVILNGRLW